MPILNLTTTLAAETGPNTSANPAYNSTNYPTGFTGTTWITTGGATQVVDSTKYDDSLIPITPAHVSPVSIKTLIPGYTGKWYAHLTPWFGNGSSTVAANHMDVGVDCDTSAWVNAALADIQARGFDGVIVDWYGSTNYIDSVTLLIKARVATMSNFTYVIMMDQGGYTTTATLETNLSYIQTTYFGTTGYLKQGGVNVVMFFGTVGGVDYAASKASIGASYWIMQGPGQLANAWADAVFDWVQPYGSGVPGGDPYNAAAANSFLTSVHSSVKGSMPCIAPGFNGYNTRIKEAGYKKGYIMPRDSGKCWLTQASVVAANLPTHIIGIQVATWQDYEEGSAIETAIDNAIAVTASVTGSILSWIISGGTGDESTIDHYRILAQKPGATPSDTAVLGTQATGGSRTFDLTTITGWGTATYNLYVVAVAKPSIRNQNNASAPTYTAPSNPVNPTTLTGSITGSFIITLSPGAQLVPLDSNPNQTWQVSVNVNGSVITMFVYLHYNEIAGYWVMKLYDSSQNLLMDSTPLIAGLDVFQQFQSLNVGSMYILNSSGTSQDSPDDSSLGSDFVMVWDNSSVESIRLVA